MADSTNGPGTGREGGPGGSRRGDRVPGRKTRPAYSRQRRVWYGYGKQASDEKSRFGLFLHDVPYVFTEVFVIGFPALLYVFVVDQTGAVGITGPTFVAWMTMTAVGTAIHMGLVPPLATDTRGWVSISPSLVGLRLVYYNLVLLGAAYGGVALAAVVSSPSGALWTAAAVGTVAMLAFPRLGESVARRRAP
jgi:hypothetical protein